MMNSDAILIWKNLEHDLKNFVWRKVKDRALAEDIVQDVYLKAQANIGQLKDKEKFASWIYRITRHVVVDYFRKNSATTKPMELQWDNSPNEFNDCVAHCLEILVERLPEKYREALKLTELENMSQYQLAERLNISYSGARSRVQRARKMLKEAIENLYLIKTDAYGNIITCENRIPCCCRKEC